MDSAEFLTHCDDIRQTGHGYMVRCKAHADQSPSLSVREGERGLLLHCFAGCSVQDICAAMGLTVKDLFFDSIVSPREAAQRRAQRDSERQEKARKARREGRRIDLRKLAEFFIESRQNLNIASWNDARLDKELNTLADAYALLEQEDTHAA